jgi:hypothetical protein
VIIVYVTKGAKDLTDPLGKVVLYNGPDELINVDDAPIAITANLADYSGPVDWTDIPVSGAYSFSVRTSIGITNIIGYLDKDDNDVWEPSDWIGEAPANSLSTELGDVSGVRVLIPSIESINVPIPAAYVSLCGDVTYDGFTGGDIVVTASSGDVAGFIYSRTELAASGAFTLRVPPFSSDVVVWAVLDEDGDGIWDLSEDANDVAPTIEFVTSDVGGLNLSLDAGTYYPSAYLDIGGDNPDEPGSEDLAGVAAVAVVVEEGESRSSINFVIPN